MLRKAIVTLAVGENFSKMFDQLCKHEWTIYAEKYNFDLIVLKQSLDDSDRARLRSPAWQKLLILSQSWSNQYDQIVWLDSDIIINNKNAPDISENLPIELISAVDAYQIPNKEYHDIGLERIYKNLKQKGVPYIATISPDLYYTKRGISGGDNLISVIQTGVFVCSPLFHRELFEHIYYSYEDTHGSEWNYEMPAMSYEVLKNNMHHWINPRFNFCFANIMAAFYPYLFLNPQLNLQTVINRIFNRVVLTLHRADLVYCTRDELLALKNIYDLGFFIHFASYSKLMWPLSREIKKGKIR